MNRRAPKNTGPVAIATFATVVNPALVTGSSLYQTNIANKRGSPMVKHTAALSACLHSSSPDL